MINARCNDTRKCFARFGDHCRVLTKAYHKDGECPFAKPEQLVTNGVTYPYDKHYAAVKEKAEE